MSRRRRHWLRQAKQLGRPPAPPDARVHGTGKWLDHGQGIGKIVTQPATQKKRDKIEQWTDNLKL